MQTIPEHELQFRLASGKIDSENGILRDVTVAKAGVAAIGKFVYVGSDGEPSLNPDGATAKKPVTTDESTLKSLMAAVASAGGRIKVRSDHDDALAARAGYADNFRNAGGRVICDIHLLDSYRDREQVLEVSSETPDLIGLSIDFLPSFFMSEESALMRVDEIFAVDIVDAGAITPDGLYLSREVDKNKVTISKEKTSLSMAEKKSPPTVEDCMAAVQDLAAKHGEMTEMLKKLAAAGSPPSKAKKADKKGSSNEEKGGDDPIDDDDATDELDSDGDDDGDKYAAEVKNLSAQLKRVTASMANFQKQQDALGLRRSGGESRDQADSAEERERTRLSKERELPKSYLDLMKAEKQSDADAMSKGGKSRTVAERHSAILSAHPEAYRAHLEKRVKMVA